MVRVRATTWHPAVRGVLQAAVLAVLMLTSLGGYLLVLRWRGHGGAGRITHLGWDDWFPYSPAWVWVYLIPYLVGPALVGLLRWDVFVWFVKRALVVVMITLL